MIQLRTISALYGAIILLILPSLSSAFLVESSLFRPRVIATKESDSPTADPCTLTCRQQTRLKDTLNSSSGNNNNNNAAATATNTRSVLPTRKRKLSKKKSTNKLIKGERPSQIIDEDELADHVSTLYLNSPGGLFYQRKDIITNHSNNDQDESIAATADDTIQNLDRYPCLVLNADYQPLSCLPLSLWNWQDSVKAVFAEKVTVVDVYPGVHVRAAQLSIPLPSVLALHEYVAPPIYNNNNKGNNIIKPAFTKRNVFLRDEYRCQYCQQRFATRDLSLDHVVPRCHGGSLHWENAVTSCRHCNGRKGSLMLKDLGKVGMKLARPPRTPTPFELAAIAGRLLPRRLRLLHDSWEPYLPHSSSSMDDLESDDSDDETSEIKTMAQQLSRQQ